MQNSKLVSILKNFSKKDLKHFHDYLCSPFFNKNADLIQFFLFLKKFYPNFSKASLTKEKGYSFVYPNMLYSEKKMGYLMSDLLKLIEGYLLQKEIDANNFLKQYYLMRTYSDWKLEKPFNGALREANKIQENCTIKDAHYYYNAFLIKEIENTFFLKQKKRIFDSALQSTADNLDIYFLAQKLKFSCELLSRQNIVAADYKLHFLPETLSYIEESFDYQNHPIIAIYYKIIQVLRNSDEEKHFKDLIVLLRDNHNIFSLGEIYHMYRLAINYCIKKANRGQLKYLRDLFELYKKVIETGIVFFDGKVLHYSTFKNINSTACMIGEFEWAEKFSNEYLVYVDEELRHNAIMYNMAHLNFHRGDFEKSHYYLTQIEPTDIYYHIDFRYLLLRVYHEQNELQALQALLNSFKIYLKRNRIISDYQRLIYLNLIQFLKDFHKVKADKEKLLELKKHIIATKEMAGYQWLLKKIDEQLLNVMA